MFSQDMQISFGIAIGGLVILLVIGLLAGLLPARRALAIKPIEALNEE
jgi:putative ABC transport system permease protein